MVWAFSLASGGDCGRFYSMDTHKPEPSPFERMDALTKRVMSVPKKELDRRAASEQKSKKSANRR